MTDHFSTMNNFIKSAEYLTKPKQKRSSGNAFGISRRKDYSSEEKLFFVNLVVEGGNSKASVAKQYDIPESTLRGWCKPKHKDKLEKEALDRKSTSNVFDTPSPSSSSSSAGSGVTSAALYHQYKESPYEPHLGAAPAGIPTLQIPKVENLYYQTPLRCGSAMAEPRPLIKEEREEEVLNLSNKTEHHLTSPILTQCLNSVPGAGLPSPSNGNSIKSMQHMKHALLDMKSPSNLIDIHHNISSMFQSYSKSPQPTFGPDVSCKLSPKTHSSPSPVQYEKPDEVNVNKRKYETYASDVPSNSDYKKELAVPVSNNNNSEFYKNYEQFLNSKRSSDMYINKMEPKRDAMFSNGLSNHSNKAESGDAQNVNHYFKNYLESMVKAQKLPAASGGQEQYKLAAQQLWLQQLALNQLAASSMSQLPNAMQQQQTAAALQQQQLLYERQLLNSRLNQQPGVPPTGAQAEEKIYSWTSQLHANQRELEEKLKLLIQTQQQILSDKNQSPPEPDTDRVKRLRTMNVRDMLETHRQSLDKSLDEDQEIKETLDLSSKPEPRILHSPPVHFRPSPCPRGSSPNISFRTSTPPSNTFREMPPHNTFRATQSPLSNFCPSPSSSFRASPTTTPVSRVPESLEPAKPLDTYEEPPTPEQDAMPPHDGNYLDTAILHGEQFLADLEKVSHPKLTLQHIRQIRDLLCKLRTPVFENNNSKEAMEDPNCKSKRKSLLNIVHNLTN